MSIITFQLDTLDQVDGSLYLGRPKKLCSQRSTPNISPCSSPKRRKSQSCSPSRRTKLNITKNNEKACTMFPSDATANYEKSSVAKNLLPADFVYRSVHSKPKEQNDFYQGHTWYHVPQKAVNDMESSNAKQSLQAAFGPEYMVANPTTADINAYETDQTIPGSPESLKDFSVPSSRHASRTPDLAFSAHFELRPTYEDRECGSDTLQFAPVQTCFAKTKSSKVHTAISSFPSPLTSKHCSNNPLLPPDNLDGNKLENADGVNLVSPNVCPKAVWLQSEVSSTHTTRTTPIPLKVYRHNAAIATSYTACSSPKEEGSVRPRVGSRRHKRQAVAKCQRSTPPKISNSATLNTDITGFDACIWPGFQSPALFQGGCLDLQTFPCLPYSYELMSADELECHFSSPVISSLSD